MRKFLNTYFYCMHDEEELDFWLPEFFVCGGDDYYEEGTFIFVKRDVSTCIVNGVCEDDLDDDDGLSLAYILDFDDEDDEGFEGGDDDEDPDSPKPILGRMVFYINYN